MIIQGALSLDMGRFFTGYGIGIFLIWTSPLHCSACGLILYSRVTKMAGLKKEFKVDLCRLCGTNADVSVEAIEIQASIGALQALPKAKMMDLFDAKYICSVIDFLLVKLDWVATCHLSNRDISRVLPCWYLFPSQGGKLTWNISS
ncbi:hypothetical protein LguiA_015434 [Lonicera macranthoides]